MTLAQRKLLSLDANLVFDLARDEDFAHEFREVFRQKGYGMPQTSVAEVPLLVTSDKHLLDIDEDALA